jgi:prophage regulatory protein
MNKRCNCSSTGNPTETPFHLCGTTSYPKLLRLTEVRKRVPLSRAEIYRRVADGSFPRQIHIGANAVAWSEQAINDWIAARINANRKDDGSSNSQVA